MRERESGARPRPRVIAAALAGILLLAAAVCLLHGVNAVSLRGTAQVSGYERLERTQQAVTLEDTDAATLPVFTDGERSFALFLEEPEVSGGLLRISGMLLRLEQSVGEVRVRVGLVPVRKAQDGSAAWAQEMVLLSTQMVRRSEAAQALGVDDHCGFCAAAARSLLEDGQYAVVLADESDGACRLIDTGVSVILMEDGYGIGRVNGPREEAQHE